jgi:carbon monoxide dehydrogenase subunit G
MAMNMTGEVQLPASRETVWAMLNELAVLKSCIPGCESLDKDSDNEFGRSPRLRSVLSRRAGKGK